MTELTSSFEGSLAPGFRILDLVLLAPRNKQESFAHRTAEAMGTLIGRRAAGYICRSCTRQHQVQSQLRRNYSNSARPDIYDVVCVGGGPAGLSLLTALRRSPKYA